MINVMSVCDTTDKCASCLVTHEVSKLVIRKKGGGVCLHNEANEPWLNDQVGNE